MMKNFTKISLLVITLFSFYSLPSFAQTSADKTGSYWSGVRLSAGPDAGIPVGSFHNNFKWNIGGSIAGDFPVIKDQLYATINGGYDNFFAKDQSGLPDIHLIPVMAGLKYFLVKFVYVQGEAGASFLTNKNALGFDKSTSFVYAPQAGVLFNIGGKNYIDAAARFEGNTKFYSGGKSNNFIGLRVAYAFDL